MIGFGDALTLAGTKLRTRKVRLIVTVVVSGLLFCGLAAASIVMRGVFASVESFSKEGFGERYVVSANVPYSPSVQSDPELLARAETLQKDLVARKKAEAKRLGVYYDPASELPAINEYDSPIGKERSINPESMAAKQALQEYSAAHPDLSIDDLKKVASRYGATNYYETMTYSGVFGNIGSLNIMENGKENFTSTEQEKMNASPVSLEGMATSWTSASADLIKPFLLEGADLAAANANIPIVLPSGVAEKLLGLKSLPANASSNDKLARLREIRQKAASLTFQTCFRNQSSDSLLQQAKAQTLELEQNKNNKDYLKPSLIYGLPTEGCGAVPIIRDSRSFEEKQTAAKQLEFDQLFGKPSAEQYVLTFRVVGLSPDVNYGGAFSFRDILRTVVMSNIGSGWYTPKEYIETQPQLAKLFAKTANIQGVPATFYAELPTAAAARELMSKENCEPDFGAMQSGPLDSNFDPYQACRTNGKPFTYSAFGSNSLALDSAKRGFTTFFTIAVANIAVIASIIMLGTVGRSIADSRRETAVFRAIGAKRIDIASIYVLYAVMLALLIALFAIVVGSALASFVHGRYSQDMTIEALTTYNAQDLSRQFVLFKLYPRDMLYLTGLLVGGGLLSTIFPLLRNLRRNPIRDMRDEN